MTDNLGSEATEKSPLSNAILGGEAPLVSVVIPTFRRHKLLAKALRSVRAQSYRPLQIIVIDDDADPATEIFLKDVLSGAADVQIVFQSQPNLGAAAARNLGLDAALGDFVQFLDDDDELYPEKISDQVNFLIENDCDIVFGDWMQGQDIPSARRFRARESGNHFAFLISEGWIPNFAYLARMQSCRDTGGWNAALKFNDDFDFFLRLAAQGADFRRQPLPTGFYRWHPGPRVSAADRRIRIRTNCGIIETAEVLKRKMGEATPTDVLALIDYWRRLATEAARDVECLRRCCTEIERLRREIGRDASAIERLLGPSFYYKVRENVGPVQWGRGLVHRLLPLGVRRWVRRFENAVRASFS